MLLLPVDAVAVIQSCCCRLLLSLVLLPVDAAVQLKQLVEPVAYPLRLSAWLAASSLLI